jgi:hypothetical protein
MEMEGSSVNNWELAEGR